MLKKIFPLRKKEWVSLIIIVVCIIALSYYKVSMRPYEDVTDTPIDFRCWSGVVKEINKDSDGNIESFCIETEDSGNRVITISEVTGCIDYVKEFECDLSDIEVGHKIFAYCDLASFNTEPPQSSAFLIIINADGSENSTYYSKVSRIKKSGNDSGIKLVGDELGYVISKNTVIVPYKLKIIVTMEDIKEGSAVIIWRDKNTNELSKIMLIE